MEEIRRPVDGELCGLVAQRGDRWLALAVFGATLGRHSTREDAVAQVLSEGLAALAGRWTLRSADGRTEEVVCIQEASPRRVTVALGSSPVPGQPTLTITASQIAAGDWCLYR